MRKATKNFFGKIWSYIWSCITSWFSVGGNIFQSDLGDALFYLVLYIAVPIFITAGDLIAFPTDSAAAAYPYTCIIVSAANCFYDIRNRWDRGAASVQNTKLFLMGFATVCVGLYAAFEVFLISGKQITNMRYDKILYVYFLACAISIIDALCCFGTKLALRNNNNFVNMEVVSE